MQERRITWAQYHHLIAHVAEAIQAADWPFQGILCLARGGVPLGDALSRRFHKPLAILRVAAYGGEEERSRGQVDIADHLTYLGPPIAGTWLIADDLVDSGDTLIAARDWFVNHYPRVTEVKSAVIWWKGSSHLKPDYYAEFLPDCPWIVQPFEGD